MKEKQRELIVEIMKADEKSGIYPAMKQTAVDYLLSELQNVIELYKTEWEELDSIVKQAKQMEKEQIKEAHLNGQSEWDIKALEDINKKLAEEYYKETYE